MISRKTRLNRFKKIEVISSIFLDDSGMKVGINYKKKTGEDIKT